MKPSIKETAEKRVFDVITRFEDLTLSQDEQKEYLDELSKIPSPTYSAYKSNFDSVWQSISESLDFKIDQIETKRKQFFADSRFSKTNQDKLLDELKKLYAILISNSNNDM